MWIQMACSCLRNAALLMMLVLARAGICAEGDILWFRTYGGVQNEEPFALLPADNGGWMLGAETNSFGAGSQNIWLILMDDQGDSLWSHTYGDAYAQAGRALINDGYGGWLLVVNRWIFGPPWFDAGLYRIGSNGDTLWTWLCSGGGMNELVAAVAVGDCFLAAGHTESMGAGGLDQWLLRFDMYGDTLWTRTWGGWNTDQATTLLPTFDGGSLLVGTTTSFSQMGQDITLWRNDDQGDSLWFHVYGEDEPQAVNDIVATSDGGWLLACLATNHFGYSVDDVWLLRVDADGNELWSKFYGGPNNEVIKKILPTADGGWLLAGMAHPQGPLNQDLYLLRVDANGDSLWSRTYGTAFPEGMSAAIVTPDSGCLLGGSVYDTQTDQNDWWILKTGANGDSLWSMTFGDSLWDDFIDFVSLTADDNYLIVGETGVNSAGMWDIGLMCLAGADTLSAVPTSPMTPYSWRLEAPHPNPFNAITVLSFQLPVASHTKLGVYDIAGRLVATLVDGWRQAGRHEVTFDGSKLASGIYIARLKAGDYIGVQKPVLLK